MAPELGILLQSSCTGGWLAGAAGAAAAAAPARARGRVASVTHVPGGVTAVLQHAGRSRLPRM